MVPWYFGRNKTNISNIKSLIHGGDTDMGHDARICGGDPTWSTGPSQEPQDQKNACGATAAQKRTRKEEGMLRRGERIKEERGDSMNEPKAKLIMHDDNTAMIQVCRSARNNQMKSMGRTFGVSIRSLHEATQRDDFELGPIRSEDMVADIHTSLSRGTCQ